MGYGRPIHTNGVIRCHAKTISYHAAGTIRLVKTGLRFYCLDAIPPIVLDMKPLLRANPGKPGGAEPRD